MVNPIVEVLGPNKCLVKCKNFKCDFNKNAQCCRDFIIISSGGKCWNLTQK